MNREMKAAMEAALQDILAMSPEDFLAAANKTMSGDVFEFLMSTGKFESFDLKQIEPHQIQFAEAMPEKIVDMLTKMRVYEARVNVDTFDSDDFALAA
ncbi:hypothetical protein U4K77_24455 [Klebsiella pneumoniae]|uniref:hypothetical protein n=1 Tax=Klebsiella pneumoniae TaxID=573 RepID=UPI0018A61A04|nr:hypothetical protein [Klebsiella pneumoniae]ELA0483324.1 hypothetical protein [Klebsiella pneumoniae]MCC5680417.1 hypothetical protein [Klebsiella pneumoniae]MCP5730163.1 hypothetical protein [Klebsiella pneumoniae]MCP5852066.1 hypothetical protein [Klebsiella pneumoniae]MCP6104421.1 hypothetical protein [Klebsiella pneumoniae]